MSDNTNGGGAPASAPVEASNTSAPEAAVKETEVVEGEEGEEIEGAEGAEGELEAAAPEMTKAEKKALEKQLRKYKLKVDGEEFEEELDLNNEEEVKKRLQLARVSQKRMAEAADIRKSAEEFIKLLKENPKRILSDPNIGVDLKKFATDIINEQLEEEAKSPEQKERERVQKELEDLRAEKKKIQEEKEAAEFKRLQDEAFNRIDMDITETLQELKLPKKPYVLKKFAELLEIVTENDLDISAKDLGPFVRKSIIEDIQEMAGAADDNVLEEIIGKDVLGRIRKNNLAKARKSAPSASSVKPTVDSSKPTDSKPKEKVNMKDFFKNLGKS